MKRAFVLSLALLASAFVYGQRTLTLDECRSLAIQNNKELQIAGKSMTVKTGSDKRIYVLYLVFLFLYNLFSLASEKY
jgi:hypothetical protein